MATATPTQDEVQEVLQNAVASQTTHITIFVPVEMKALIKQAAEEAGLNHSAWMKSVLAEAIGYTLPPAERRNSGLSAEEQKVARKAAAQTKRKTINQLLEMLKSGQITLPSTNGS